MPKTSRRIIRREAFTNGWTLKSFGYRIDDFRKGSRHVNVYYNIADEVNSATRGSTHGGGWRITGGKDRVITFLKAARWTKGL